MLNGKSSSGRTKSIPKVGERVLILGGTSGIGRTMARRYAERGARVCVVGRREALLDEVVEECRRAANSSAVETGIVGLRGDFTNAGDMVRVRAELLTRWGGLDTLVVSAGVSALQPLLAVAGADCKGSALTPMHTTLEGIQKTSDVSLAAIKGNYTGPLIAAVTFIPTLSATSKSPSIALINTLASIIPAPTRSLYASTKGAGLILYQSLAIEHPQITFTHFMPATVEGDFRASAVDSGPVREKDPNKHGLKREDVARRCIEAVDRKEKTVFMPRFMRIGHLLYWLIPSYVEKKASLKYNFES
ncbi:NAD(P)-binding protein [Coprinellus micaceus]|uniref:NAD(P)-binding protein n=1 Tax=Coprinellus micaceus TaxID=71717 RepID=A0A4Y7T5D0_COPMI|nr:NAD(P)-binding protein [Coprinellus micaceus]